MDVKKIINKKLGGSSLTNAELEFIIMSYVGNTINDSIMPDFLKSVHQNGMVKDEIVSLTRIMINSGETIDFSDLKSFVADKHSTGGVGDKVSIILGPIMASLGIAVPMLAGRSLGHTGGTIDKLETIPGFNTNLTIADFKNNVERSGVCIMSQTESICPADKKIYALRDITGTIDSIPLICGSIMSKKISEGIDGLVLDIKIGNGAFMRSLSQGKKLGTMLKFIGEQFNVSTKVVYSNMDQPLGKTAGMWCEIEESIHALKGDGSEDLMRVIFELGSKLIIEAGIVETTLEATEIQKKSIDSGMAFEKFEEMVSNQDGIIKNADELNAPIFSKEITSKKDGYLKSFDTTAVGWAAVEMGCGRKIKSDKLDNTAGIKFNAKVGDYIEKGDRIMSCFNSDNHKLNDAHSKLIKTFQLSDEKVKSPDLIYQD